MEEENKDDIRYDNAQEQQIVNLRDINLAANQEPPSQLVIIEEVVVEPPREELKA